MFSRTLRRKVGVGSVGRRRSDCMLRHGSTGEGWFSRGAEMDGFCAGIEWKIVFPF